jgi:hypothetical protein
MIEYFHKHKYLIFTFSILIIIIMILIFNKLFENVDCIVSEWSSSCPCHPVTGSETRTRTVIRHPKNKGNLCPPLKETIPCTLLFVEQGNAIIQNYNTAIMNNGSRIASFISYNIHNYNILLKLTLPNNMDGIINFTDDSTIYMYSLNPGNKITLIDGTYNYKPGDIFQVSYNKSSITTNLIDSTTNNNIHSYTQNIRPDFSSEARLIMGCTSPPTSSYTFTDIIFYSIP